MAPHSKLKEAIMENPPHTTNIEVNVAIILEKISNLEKGQQKMENNDEKLSKLEQDVSSTKKDIEIVKDSVSEIKESIEKREAKKPGWWLIVSGIAGIFATLTALPIVLNYFIK